MEFLTQALAALPTVATSWYALVAYGLTVVAWVVIAWRVERNKNLLANVKDLPEADRIRVLQMDMGNAYLESGLTPEQWLQAKRHRYLFWGYALSCLVVVVLVAISLYYAARPAAAGTPVVQKSAVDKLKEMKVGAHWAYYESLFGVPLAQECDSYYCSASYEFDEFHLQLIFQHPAYLEPDIPLPPKQELTLFRYVVFSRFDTLDINIPLVTVRGKKRCLGCFTFADTDTKFKNVLASEGLDACYVEQKIAAMKSDSAEGVALIWSRDHNVNPVDAHFAEETLDFALYREAPQDPTAVAAARARLRPNGFMHGDYSSNLYPTGVYDDRLSPPSVTTDGCRGPDLDK